MKTKVKYNKCKTCENAGWSMPQCAECNRANDYRYYNPGRPIAPSGVGTLNPEDMEADEELETLRKLETWRKRELHKAATILRTECPGDSEQMELAKHVGAAAIERLTPEKPEEKTDELGLRALCCPNCSSPVTNYWVRGAKPLHCQFCGQALDWGEEAEE